MKTINHILLISVFSTLYFTGMANEAGGVYELLRNDEIPTLTLRMNLVQLLENKNADDTHPALISWETQQGVQEEWRVKVSPRGKFRRRMCDFPPLRLKFNKGELAQRGLNRHNKLKLVTHCLDTRSTGQDNLLREYLAYKMYQELTPYAYRVQLVRIHYVDDAKRVNGFRRYAFLIEDTDDMAERLGGQECDDCLNPSPAVMDVQAENLHALFQYMISNTDYSLPMVRNLKLVTRPNGELIPVGYDFDFSGLVNTAYALPANELGQTHVRQRVFLGLPVDDSIVKENIALLLQKERRLRAIIADCKLLSWEHREDMQRYLDAFFAEMTTLSQRAADLYPALKLSHPTAMPAGGMQENYRVVR